MNTYRRILEFVYPYWKHIIVSVVCTLLYSILHGASVYLSIPLLDTLFQQSENVTEKISQTTNITDINIVVHNSVIAITFAFTGIPLPSR